MKQKQESKLMKLALLGLAILSLLATQDVVAATVRAVSRCGDGGVWVGHDTFIGRYTPAGVLLVGRNVGFNVYKLTLGDVVMNEVWAGYGNRVRRFNGFAAPISAEANVGFDVTALAPCWDDRGVWVGFDTFMRKFNGGGFAVTAIVN